MVLPKGTNQPASISSKSAAQKAQEKQSARLPKAVSAGSAPPNRTIANIKSSSGNKAPSTVSFDEPTASTNIQVDSDKDQPISISSQTAPQDAQGKQSPQGFSTKQPKTSSNASETPAQGAEAKQTAQDFSTQQPNAASDGSDPSNASDGSNPPSNTTETQGKPSAQSGTPLRRSEPSPPVYLSFVH